jgi:opacity protein-like surface antigen
MLKTNQIATIILGAALAAAPALAQENGRSEVSVQAFGSFVKSTTDNGIGQSATNSGGVLGSYRFFFTNNIGVEANYGYSRNTQSYSSFSASSLGVNSNEHEVTAAIVYRHPLHSFTPFVEAGTGALIFDPRNFSGASNQGRAAFVYGGGADFNITKRAFLRAEYRGLVYDSPTFDILAADGADRVTHRAEPSVGFGYRF